MLMVKDLVSGKEWKEPLRLDLGCGPWKRPGFIGIDIRNFWEGNKIKDYEVKADIFYDLQRNVLKFWLINIVNHVVPGVIPVLENGRETQLSNR